MRTQGSAEKEKKGINDRPLGETDVWCGQEWMESRMEQGRDPALFSWVCQSLPVFSLPPRHGLNQPN